MRSIRRPVGEVIQGVDTTSEKIRRLGREGYLRTEIASALGIRYQHVRKVLLDAGIGGGLQQVTPSLPASPSQQPPVRSRGGHTLERRNEPVHHGTLLDAGFQLLGGWRLSKPGEIELTAVAPREPGVYAFALNDILFYIGVSERGLRVRMRDYRIGHPRQRTSSRVKNLIFEALSAGHSV
jgi:hypothetical protein